MSFYDVDFAALVRILLPVRLRKTLTIRWLLCLIKPVQELYDKFCANRNNNIYTLTHNGQVVRLQVVLNDTFDPVSRRIYVVDDHIFDALYVYLPPETHQLWLGRISEVGATFYPNPQWLYTRTEVAFSGYQFLVMVPVAIAIDAARMNALIDKYRLPSRNLYAVVTY
jgi:hypothetical protein